MPIAHAEKKINSFIPVSLTITFETEKEFKNFKSFCGQNESVVYHAEKHLKEFFPTVADTLGECYWALDGNLEREKK